MHIRWINSWSHWMLRIEDLRGERDNPNVAFLEFVLRNPKTSKDIHAFIEGQNDTSFYRNFIRNHATDCKCRYFFYKCGDKEGVYKAYHLVMNASPRGAVLFFVDKDLSDIFNENWEKASNIYVTDYYSIENYLVSEDMLASIWTDFFHFTKESVIFDKFYQEKFQKELEHFYQFVLPIVAWGIHLKRSGKRPQMKEVRFSLLFTFKDDLSLGWDEKVEKMGMVNRLEQLCGEKTLQTWHSEGPNIVKELSSLIPKKYVRGKLELVFFVKFVEKLVMLLDKEISALKRGNVRTYTQIHENNAVEVLGPKLPIPESLRKFLLENVKTT